MTTHQEYKISGVSVLFPCKPYPSQFSMMDKIIKGIQRRQNCLIESPTGSGKSLALLCSALAWQAAEKAKQELEEIKENETNVCTCAHDIASKVSGSSPVKATAVANCVEGKQLSKLSNLSGHDEDDDFKPAGKTAHLQAAPRKPKKHITVVYDSDEEVAAGTNTALQDPGTPLTPKPDQNTSPLSACECNCMGGAEWKPKTKISKIYFGTRTHKQVAQIVRELRKTGYHDVRDAEVHHPPHLVVVQQDQGSNWTRPVYISTWSSQQQVPYWGLGNVDRIEVSFEVRVHLHLGKSPEMTVLGSREHTCIHPHVSRTKNKNEACKELLNDQGCHFKDSTNRLSSQNTVKSLGLSTAWDLEDLVTFCKTKRACPYFLSRALREDSDLIICPYNYLVDPIIRDAMQISLKGHVVILDEAHNIEDSAREAASQSLTQDSILKAIGDLESLMEANINLADHSKLRSMLKNLDMFIETNKSMLEQKEYDRSYKIWTGFHIVAQLETLGLGPRQFPEYKTALASIKADAEAAKDAAARSGRSKELVEMKPASQTVLGQMFQILDYLYRLDLKYVDDYRASLCQMFNYVPVRNDNQWLNSRSAHGGRSQVQVDVYTLHFWCMNPGVAFSDFSETRSIILTSGTLSPMSSFQSELGLEFKIQLETNHVIDDSQVWVGTLGRGPSGSTLQAVFRNLETFAFQDELGNLVLQVCQIVPHGVLCFLPSYNVLDKLMNRWECTGLKRKLDQCKMVIREPKNSDKLNFEEQLSQFYEALTPQSDNVTGTDTEGAIFFAVCRGKVSEGLDFADNFARAVITVGVPYPNFKDVQVELKRKYNDQHRHSRGLLSGSEWYEIQAFRALNQALGRCIRHKHDWGALIIVDDRFVRTADKYCKGLSKWVRNKVHTYQDCWVAMESLSKFTTGQLAVKDTRVGQDWSLINSPELKMSPKLPAQLRTTICSPLVMSPDFSSTARKIFAKWMDMTTPVKPFPIFKLGNSVRTRASPVNSMEKHQTASINRWTHQRASIPLAVDNTDGGLALSQPKPTINLHADILSHGANSLAHGTDSLAHGTDSLAHGTDSLAHGTDSLAHGTDSLAHGTDSLAHGTDSLVCGNDRLARDTKSLACDNDSLAHGTGILARGTDVLACGTDLVAHDTNANNHQVMLKTASIPETTCKLSSTTTNFQPSAPLAASAPVSAISLDTQTDSNDKLASCAPAFSWQSAGATPDGQGQRTVATATKLVASNKKCLFRRSRAGDTATTDPVSTEKFLASTDTSLLVFMDKSIPVSEDTSMPSKLIPVSQATSVPPTNASTPVSKGKLPTNISTPVSKGKLPTNISTPVSKGKFPANISTPVHKHTSTSPTRGSPNPSPLLSKKATCGQSPAAGKRGGQQDSEDKLHVRRKKRGTKRKHTSKSGLDTSIREEEATACQKQDKIVMVCSVCDCLLVRAVDKSDFQEQKSVPLFLRECESSSTSGSIFFPGNTSCGPLHDIKGCMEGVYTKYNEQEEICVQFLYCSQCLKASPHNTPAVGAEVKLAAGSGARFSKGQMWLFLGTITQRKEQ